jgi:Zn-dependent peptidase ImmA (M78 family)
MPKNIKISKIKVGYQDISLGVQSTSFQSPNDSYGEFDHRKNTINIVENLSDLDYCCTLLHEIIHAIVYYYGLTATGQPLDNDNKEEVAVNNISNGLTAVLKDNPLVLDEIKKRLNNVR